MTIKSIIVKNFESWKSAQFDFDKGINIILGQSDVGKSGVLRAEEWVRTNKPSPEKIISDWGGPTEVTITFDNGIKISRIAETTKSGNLKTNEYRISTLKDPLKALGGKVPDEVSEIFNMSDINFQDQSDPYFLFNETPGEIGRRLNQVASLSDIDVAFRNIESKEKTIKNSIKANKKSIEKENKELEKFDWIDSAEKKLKKLEIQSNKLSKIRQDEMILRNAKDKIILLDKKIKNVLDVIKFKDKIGVIYNKIDKIDKINDKLDKLEPLEENLKKLNDKIKKQSELIKFKNKINDLQIKTDKMDKINDILDRLEPFEVNLKKLNKSLDIFKKISKSQIAIKKLNDCIDNIKKIKEKSKILQSKKRSLDMSDNRLEIANKNLKSIKDKWNALEIDICPLCENEWEVNK